MWRRDCKKGRLKRPVRKLLQKSATEMMQWLRAETESSGCVRDVYEETTGLGNRTAVQGGGKRDQGLHLGFRLKQLGEWYCLLRLGK